MPAPTKAPAAAPTTAPEVAPTDVPATSAPEPTAAAPVEIPTEARYAPELPRITIDELKALIDSGARIAILDVRPQGSYDLAHIKGAVCFPWKPQLSEVDAEMVPMGDPIITYCDCGPSEHDSADVAQQLIALGEMHEIKVLADPSIVGWVDAGYPTE